MYTCRFNLNNRKRSRTCSALMFALTLTLNSVCMAAPGQPVHTETQTQRPTSSGKYTNKTEVNPSARPMSENKLENLKQQNGAELENVSLIGGQDASSNNSKLPGKTDASKSDDALKQTTAIKGDTVPTFTPEQQKDCAQVIKDNFHSWLDLLGQKGDELSLPDIGKLLEMPNISAKDAAVLSALCHYFYALEGEHDTHPVSGLTLKQIEHAVEHPEKNGSPAHVKFAEQLIANYVTAFENVRQDTHGNGWSLWGDHDPPELSENVQWKLNDCYLVSAVNGLIKNDPDALKKMIKQTGPDTFRVTFSGYDKPLDIKLTPGEVAAFSYSRHGGCYLAVIGMAVVEVMKATGTDRNAAAAQTPLGPLTDTHTFGWVQKNTFHLLTGKDFVQIHLKDYTQKEWKAFVETALKNKELIGVDYAQDQHFLTIIGLKDVDGQLSVVIKNPWGNERPFEGHSGPDGVFTIPLADMVSTKFGSITIEKSNYDHVVNANTSANPSGNSAVAQTK